MLGLPDSLYFFNSCSDNLLILWYPLVTTFHTLVVRRLTVFVVICTAYCHFWILILWIMSVIWVFCHIPSKHLRFHLVHASFYCLLCNFEFRYYSLSSVFKFRILMSWGLNKSLHFVLYLKFLTHTYCPGLWCQLLDVYTYMALILWNKLLFSRIGDFVDKSRNRSIFFKIISF